MLKGCDISKWQGLVDFDQLKTALDFVIIRSSYGTGYTDQQFIRNRDEARRVGLLTGFYHYAYPNNNTPEAEAEWFVKVIGTPQKNEILCLDFEEPYSDPVGWCLRFLDRVSELMGGYKPMLYINQALNNAQDWKLVVDANYGLWLARWDYNATAPAPVTDWPVVAMRQWSNHETFPGISVVVDANTFYGDIDTYKKYGYQGGSVASPVEPPSTIEKLPKDNVLKDIYTFLCGGFSQDEIDWRLSTGENLVQIGNSICTGDDRFKERWVTPNIPVPTQPEPSASDKLVQQVHDILYGSGFWFVKYWKIKALIPK